MDPLSAAEAWQKRWETQRSGCRPSSMPWPYKARAPDDRLSHERSMWIIRRLGPAWSDGQSGEWYSTLAWEDNDTVIEFWFRDQGIFTEFTLRWC